MIGILEYLYSFIYNPSSAPAVVDVEKKELKTRKYGWKKGNGYLLTPKHMFQVLKNHMNIKYVDLRSSCPDVYDQGHLGSCTANAIGFCYHYDELKEKESEPFIPSRLFIYYNERNLEGHVDTDSGAEIHDGIQVIHTIGVCSEIEWPYNIDHFTDKPTDECYNNAKNHKTIDYRAVNQNLEQLKSALIEGYPVVFGFNVYESFESEEVAKTGIMPIPKDGEKLLGGHAVALVGFDDNNKRFIVRNSWGANWGDKGYFYMPYEFIVNSEMASDFWTVTKTIDEQENEGKNDNITSDVQNDDLSIKKQTLEDHIKTKIIYDKIILNNKMTTDFSQNTDDSDLIVVSKRNRKFKLKDS